MKITHRFLTCAALATIIAITAFPDNATAYPNYTSPIVGVSCGNYSYSASGLFGSAGCSGPFTEDQCEGFNAEIAVPVTTSGLAFLCLATYYPAGPFLEQGQSGNGAPLCSIEAVFNSAKTTPLYRNLYNGSPQQIGAGIAACVSAFKSYLGINSAFQAGKKELALRLKPRP